MEVLLCIDKCLSVRSTLGGGCANANVSNASGVEKELVDESVTRGEQFGSTYVRSSSS